MDYIHEAEKGLKNYNRLTMSLQQLERRLDKLSVRGGPTARVTAALELSGVRASRLRSAEQIVFEILETQSALAETKEALANIDSLLDNMSRETGCEWYGQMLREWYICRRPRKELEALFCKSNRSLYNMRSEAIKAFAVAYFGIRPLRGM